MKQVEIGQKLVGIGQPCYIVLEASATYANLDEAKKLTKIASNLGANAIKFQNLFPGDAERILGRRDLTVEFTSPTGKKHETMFDAIKRREMSIDEWIELSKFSDQLGIDFVATPYFPEALEIIHEMKTSAIKINKGDINNVLFIEEIAKLNLPIILDGREKFTDVEIAIEICEKVLNDQIIIMHCPSGYPAESSGVHLSAIKSIQEKYDYPVGYADHSFGDLMNYTALGLGVNMIEKTITLDKTREQSEHFMSLEPSEIELFIKNVKEIEKAMGTPDVLNSSRVNDNLRRCFVSKRDIKKDEKITPEMLDFQRPGDAGISCSEGFKIITKKTLIDIPKGAFFQWDMLS